MAKAVIFDKDGVLVDTEGVIAQALRAIIERNSKIPYDPTDNIALRGIAAIDTAPILIDKYALSLSPQEFLEEYSDEYKRLMKDRPDVVMDGVVELIASLIDNNIKIAVGTNSNKERTKISLQTIEQYFKVIVVASDVKYAKPAPDVFLEAAQRLGVDPLDCVVVGDTNNDAIAASKAGMKFIFFDHKLGITLGITPHKTIHSIREINVHDIKEM